MKKMLRKFMLEGYGLKYSMYVIGEKFMISKALYKSNKFIRIEGLNLTKAEVEVYGGKRFHFIGILHIRVFNLILTYNKQGYLSQCKNMSIKQY